MADKYLSVSALRELLGIPSNGQCTGCQFATLHGCKDDLLRKAREAIDDAPEAVVRPVGEISDVVDEAIDFLNSVSEQMPYHVYSALFDLIYGICPNCGADMREREENAV